MTRAFDASTAARKFFAATSREALRLVREALGAEAMVLTNRVLPDGVEIVAMATEDVAEAVELAQAAPLVVGRAPADPPVAVSAPAAPILQAMSVAAAPAPAVAAPAVPPVAPIAAVAKSVAALPPIVAPAPVEAAASGAAGQQPDPVLSELHSMRGMLEEQMASMAWSEQQRKDPVRGRLLRTLLGGGFSAQLSRAMLERLPTGQSYAQGMAYVRSELMRVMSVREDEEALLAEGGVYALMGPTGVGKTTTTAKLAARCVMRFGADKIALVTTDSYRIGAYEQLRIYGQLLDVPVYAVKDAADLHLVLKDLREKHLVLIDTVGMSQRDRAVSNQIAMLCSGERPVKRLLLLNATSHGDTLNEVVHAYRSGAGAGELAGCIFTKVDEATHTGALIDTVIRHRLTVHYVSSGQKVPENLMLADCAQLVDGVFQPRRHAALFTATETDKDNSADAEIAQAQAETDRLRARYQRLIHAMAHDAEAVADAAGALGAATIGFEPARELWRRARDGDADQRAVLQTLMDLARSEVAAGCERHVLAVSGQLGLQASESGDRYTCQASLLLSDRHGQPVAAPRQWLSTVAGRQPGVRQTQWLREQDFGGKTLVHMLPRLPAAELLDQLQGALWMARVPASTSVIDLRTGLPAALARLELAFGAPVHVVHKGKPALQSHAELAVRMRASQADAPALRCVVTRLVDARTRKPLAQGYGLCNVGAEEADARRLAQWLAWSAEAEPCLRLVRQGLALCGGMGEPGDPHMFKRLLVAAQVSTTVWRVQTASDAWADATRALLVQLTGKAVRAGRAVSPSVLFAGMDKLFALLEALGPDFAAPAAPAATPAVAEHNG